MLIMNKKAKLTTQPPILEVKNLTKRYGSVTAVDDLSFDIPHHGCFGLLGPNGAGKTTTVEMIQGIIRPDSGSIQYRGQPSSSKLFHQKTGIQFQSTTLQDFLTVHENLKLFASFYENPIDIDTLVTMCALGDFLNRDARKLSGGQKQRVALALALINDPDLLFLDEPTMGLDPQARRNFWLLIEGIKKRGKTVVLTTHYMEEAYSLCDEIIILDQGRILIQGSPKKLVEDAFEHFQVVLPLSALSSLQKQEALKFDILPEMIVIQTPRVDDVLAHLTEQKVPLDGLMIKKPTLEDLFLELTGHSLRD